MLTAADIDRLANKADQGFDLSQWRPRRGRPSLSATEAGRSPRVGARVPDDLYRRATEPNGPIIRLGDAIVVSTRSESSIIRIEVSREAIQVGDLVAIHR